MIDVVGDVDVLAEQPVFGAAGEETAAVFDRRGAEVGEHLSYQIEHRRRFQNHRVAVRRELPRLRRCGGFASSAAARAGTSRDAASQALALAQPELSAPIAVMENCAIVSQ